MIEVYKINDSATLLLREGSLFLQGTNGLYDLNSRDYSLYLLPLLECDIASFYLKIQKCLIKADDVNEIIRDLLKCPINNEMEYWSELALNWVEQRGNAIELLDWARNVNINWMSQSLKSRFRKIFNIKSYPDLAFRGAQ